MKPFPRRTYQSFGAFLDDVRYLFARRPLIRQAMRESLSPAFRERLMLVVTQVNDCRYCRHYHTGEADKAGIAPVELKVLLDGEIPPQAPPDEIPALRYARYWAEMDAHPPASARDELIAQYGEERAAAIDIALHMIRVGNLLGNTFDSWLYRLSFGRWGLTERDKYGAARRELG